MKSKMNAFILKCAGITAIFLASCASDTGELTGVLGRNPWFHDQPLGTVYIPSGTFHTGQADQDIFQTYLTPNKQMTVVAMYMDETEITNNEYRQFVDHVIDSIARAMLDDDGLYFPENEQGQRYIDHSQEIDWEKRSEDLEDMYYTEDERFRGKRQIDTRKLIYNYQWFDLESAAKATIGKAYDKYDERNKINDRSNYIKTEETHIYPDTLCWIRDFTYSMNDPMTRQYFHHVKYDDYPVVGVNWHQANAFCVWRTIRKNSYWESLGYAITEDFRLPTEYEWEYAARGKRIGQKYPWGGPYTRNSKGCMLANFKPLRGHYGADGGVYPVRADSYFPNDYGLYNMAGNVAEWTSTKWEKSNNAIVHDLNGQNSVRISERGPDSKTTDFSQKSKVIRGGSWKDIAYFIENGSRTYEYQDSSKSFVGFRTVQTYIGRSNKDRK